MTVITPAQEAEERKAKIKNVLPRRGRSPERAQFLTDVVVTAIEGGVQYWARVTLYRWFYPDIDGGTADHRPGEPNAYAYLRAIDDGRLRLVDPDTIARALGTLRRGPVKYLEEDSRRRILAASRANDAGDLDASDADVLVQIGLFGEVIYG